MEREDKYSDDDSGSSSSERCVWWWFWQARAVSFADMAVMSEDMEGQQATGGGGLVPLTACVQGRVATPASRDVRGVRARNGLRSTSCCRTAYSIPPWLGRGVCDDLGVTTHTTVRARTKATVGVSRTSLNACQRKAQRITATFTDAIWELRGYLLRRSCNLVRCKVSRLQFSLQPRHVTRR